jgi:transcriptional regulator with XRE-family HTH domain
MISNTSQTVAVNIKRLRERQHLSQAELAEKAHTVQCHICHIECGKVEPRLPMLSRIAEALECPLSDLIAPPPELVNPG